MLLGLDVFCVVWQLQLKHLSFVLSHQLDVPLAAVVPGVLLFNEQLQRLVEVLGVPLGLQGKQELDERLGVRSEDSKQNEVDDGDLEEEYIGVDVDHCQNEDQEDGPQLSEDWQIPLERSKATVVLNPVCCLLDILVSDIVESS